MLGMSSHKSTVTRRNQSGQGRGIAASGKTISGGAYAQRQYFEAEEVRLAGTLDLNQEPSAHTVTDNASTSDDGLTVKKTKQTETLYALCERSTASPFSPHHVRPLTAVGKKMSGGADTVALCGAEVAWDVSDITLTEAANDLEGQQHESFRVCKTCVEKARELTAA